jgi:hypothetical protein
VDRLTLIKFYDQVDYSHLREGNPARPSEWHIPIQTSKFKERDLQAGLVDKEIRIELTPKATKAIRTTLLQESLFSFYKGFYNYLALRKMQDGGLEHWINITSYYSKLFFARSLNTLCGKQVYSIRSDKEYFNEAIFKVLEPNKYASLKSQLAAKVASGHKFDFTTPRFLSLQTYYLHLSINYTTKKAELNFSTQNKQRESSHGQIWKTYTDLNLDGLGLTSLLQTVDYHELIEERNEENYSFEGYRQLDFNLEESNFLGFFERDYLKDQNHLVYDDTSNMVFAAFCEQRQLFQDLNVKRLPIENYKFRSMIMYTLSDSEFRKKLLELCDKDFPISNEYTNELHDFYER